MLSEFQRKPRISTRPARGSLASCKQQASALRCSLAQILRRTPCSWAKRGEGPAPCFWDMKNFLNRRLCTSKRWSYEANISEMLGSSIFGCDVPCPTLLVLLLHPRFLCALLRIQAWGIRRSDLQYVWNPSLNDERECPLGVHEFTHPSQKHQGDSTPLTCVTATKIQYCHPVGRTPPCLRLRRCKRHSYCNRTAAQFHAGDFKIPIPSA